MAEKKQYGVIPYTEEDGKIKVFLVTSRTNNFWIFPKGNRQKHKSPQHSAIQEAFEEAGVIGKIEKDRSYEFFFEQHNKKHTVILYPMKVKKALEQWPEKKERKRKSVCLKKAYEMIEIEGFKHCLRNWAKKRV